jgi:hypothetical protein
LISNSQYGPLDQKDRRTRAENGLISAYLTSFSGESGQTVAFLPHIENCCELMEPLAQSATLR